MQFRHLGSIDASSSQLGAVDFRLTGIHVDRQGFLYAVGGRLVQVFDTDGSQKNYWQTGAIAASVQTDADDRVWIGEVGQVEIFDLQGKLLATWKDPDRLALVTAIGIDDEGVFLADGSGRAIRRYDLKGNFKFSIGAKKGAKGFSVPNGYLDFSLDAQGVVFAANPGKHRIEKFSRQGELIGKFGQFGMRDPAHFRGCCNPTNVSVSASGHVIVTEKAGPRVKIFDSSGSFIGVIAEKEFDPNCKNMDIAVDRSGRIYVADTVRQAIEIFEPIES